MHYKCNGMMYNVTIILEQIKIELIITDNQNIMTT